jgi:flavin-binding protein dodecin
MAQEEQQSQELAEERIRAFTATSFKSFADAAAAALKQVPPGPEELRSARVVDQEISSGGFVGRTQYRVTVVATSPPPPNA